MLLPDHDAESTRVRVLELLASTPGGQTFSAGVATWQPGTEPAVAVAAADRALYNAKRGGRNRVCLAPYVPSGLILPMPRIALQPIVDLATGEMVAVEALSRFRDHDPMPVFEQARALGRLAELEAAAIRAARAVALPGLLLSVNVDIGSLPSPRDPGGAVGRPDRPGPRGDRAHPQPGGPGGARRASMAAIRDYRERGALIAVDDWGTGYSDMDRLELLQPEIVKVDMSIVHDLDSARHRALIGSVLAWSARRHARVCAEGIESEAQLERLRRPGRPPRPGLPHRPTRTSEQDAGPRPAEPGPSPAVRPQRTPEQGPDGGS